MPTGLNSSGVLAILFLVPVSFLVVKPWVVRMLMRKRFQGFRLAIVDLPDHTDISTGESPTFRRMTYGESVRVSWLLFWREMAVVFLAYIVFALLAVSLALPVRLAR